MFRWLIHLLLTYAVVPLIITITLYPPVRLVIFHGTNYQQADFTIDDIFASELGFRKLVADAIQTPLSLNLYKVVIQNNSGFSRSGDCIQTEPDIVRFAFIEGDPNKYGSNLMDKNAEKWNAGSQYPEYSIAQGDSAYFLARSNERYSINGGFLYSSGCLQIVSSTSFPTVEGKFDFKISITPYWPAWFSRLILITLFWTYLFSSILGIEEWRKDLRKRKIRK